MRGLTHTTRHTHDASPAKYISPGELYCTRAIGVLPSRNLLRDDVRCTCAFSGFAFFASSVRNGCSLPDSFDFFWLKRNDAENRRTPHRRSDMPKWKTRSPGCTLPQNKLDTLMEFLGFPAVGGVFPLYPAPFGAGAPVQW